jgi:glutamyl-tRNA reductase
VTLPASHLYKIVLVFALIHQQPGSESLPVQAPVWRTCLREIAFLEDAASAGARVIDGESAYCLLLEVVCGLRSPLVGETEVQSQFKAFLSSLNPVEHRWLLGIGQQILADAKQVRHRHLQGVSTSASYGRLVQRLVAPDRRVVLIGTGSLGTQIATALGDTHQIDQWGRTPAALDGSDAARSWRQLHQPDPAGQTRPCVLIIAAPIRHDDLASVLARYDGAVAEILDLRARDERTPLPAGIMARTLDDVLALAAREDPGAARIAAAQAAVRDLARTRGVPEQQRPFGWEDVCA